ncbi:hypothetical protein F4604DRAFT_486873 [Suillus subluteus]|nr:hypothetical protein F4604DRAFT_486873 [Suillus subluteus]
MVLSDVSLSPNNRSRCDLSLWLGRSQEASKLLILKLWTVAVAFGILIRYDFLCNRSFLLMFHTSHKDESCAYVYSTDLSPQMSGVWAPVDRPIAQLSTFQLAAALHPHFDLQIFNFHVANLLDNESLNTRVVKKSDSDSPLRRLSTSEQSGSMIFLWNGSRREGPRLLPGISPRSRIR